MPIIFVRKYCFQIKTSRLFFLSIWIFRVRIFRFGIAESSGIDKKDFTARTLALRRETSLRENSWPKFLWMIVSIKTCRRSLCWLPCPKMVWLDADSQTARLTSKSLSNSTKILPDQNLFLLLKPKIRWGFNVWGDSIVRLNFNPDDGTQYNRSTESVEPIPLQFLSVNKLWLNSEKWNRIHLPIMSWLFQRQQDCSSFKVASRTRQIL